jgi:hypothetical protein
LGCNALVLISHILDDLDYVLTKLGDNHCNVRLKLFGFLLDHLRCNFLDFFSEIF